MNIKKAAAETGLTADTIRYYERIGIIGPVPRLANDIRDFGQRSLNQLHFAKVMRQAGMSIELLKQYIDYIYEDDDETVPARKALLAEAAENMSQKIQALTEARDYLHYKIEHYDSHMRSSEQHLL
ncbi:MerR family transcriptional regulator [Leuconostocaceae bacterium ESL0958]|nr:MerR family transcriptional regulator [Leuconostocaceae bacterium ESL0958]